MSRRRRKLDGDEEMLCDAVMSHLIVEGEWPTFRD